MIDLHTHSIYSDGTNSPAELIKMAEERGVVALALTDHDTVAGISEMLDAATYSSVEGVSGIELSAECDHGTMHILGYFIDHTAPLLLEKLEKVREGRMHRNQSILKKLNKLGYVLLWSDVIKQAGKDVVGRPHFAAALMERGYIKSKKSAFELLLAKGRPAYFERYRYTPEECIDLIRSSGGVPVLAHPATILLSDEKLLSLIKKMRDIGLGGIESYYAEQHPANIQKFSEWAKSLNLVSTGGTDFHGDNTPALKIGTGFGQLHVPDETLSLLKSALE